MFPKNNPSKSALTLAIKALNQIEKSKITASLALARVIKKMNVKDRGAISYANRLVKETLRRQNVIDNIIRHSLAPESMKNLGFDVKSFLRIYVYQTKLTTQGGIKSITMAQMGRSILGWNRVAPIEEALGKILNLDLKALHALASDEERVGLKTFHPTWFVRYCIRLLGRNRAISFLRKNMDIPPTYIRINTLKGNEDTILSKIHSEGVQTRSKDNLRFVYEITERKVPPTRTDAFKEGLFFIQDKSSCLAVEVCDPKPGMTVIDVCAAPGGKTTYLAQLMENKGTIYSLDYSTRRMKILKSELERMGTKIVHAIIADAYNPFPLNIQADLLLLDPPCSSTGAFWKTPSAKWRIEPRSIRHLASVQYSMLEKCVNHIKLGGYLVYSTCSITVEENEMQIEKLLKRHPNFALVEAKPWVGVHGLRGQTDSQRLYPDKHDSNGFYIAKLVKYLE